MSKRKSYEFLQLTNTISYPPAKKAELSIIHSNLIEQVTACFDGTRKMKEQVIHAFNCITYMFISGDSVPSTWNPSDPLNTFRDYDDDFLEDHIKCFVHPRDVDWVDVPIVSNPTKPAADKSSEKPISAKEHTKREVPKSNPLSIDDIGVIETVVHTPKSDLYIQPPTVPRFDTTCSLASGNIDGIPFVIYKSLPEIPTKQNEISATTDVNKMTDSDLLRLFPTHFIRTRAECMYEPCDGITFDPQLGLILPVDGYTEQQIRDNIIKYPHIFKLLKEVDGLVESFYSTIEIDGELHKTSEMWRRLPESLVIPYNKEFIKEYVVRRYLLERDISGVEHRYKLYGTLEPFLTLFTTAQEYSRMGYSDPIMLAHSCVTARVSYKQTRNPVLRRLSNV